MKSSQLETSRWRHDTARFHAFLIPMHLAKRREAGLLRKRVWAKKREPEAPKGKKPTPERIVGILLRVKDGEAAEAVCRNANTSEATLYRRKQQHGAVELDWRSRS